MEANSVDEIRALMEALQREAAALQRRVAAASQEVDAAQKSASAAQQAASSMSKASEEARRGMTRALEDARSGLVDEEDAAEGEDAVESVDVSPPLPRRSPRVLGRAEGLEVRLEEEAGRRGRCVFARPGSLLRVRVCRLWTPDVVMEEEGDFVGLFAEEEGQKLAESAFDPQFDHYDVAHVSGPPETLRGVLEDEGVVELRLPSLRAGVRRLRLQYVHVESGRASITLAGEGLPVGIGEEVEDEGGGGEEEVGEEREVEGGGDWGLASYAVEIMPRVSVVRMTVSLLDPGDVAAMASLPALPAGWRPTVRVERRRVSVWLPPPIGRRAVWDVSTCGVDGVELEEDEVHVESLASLVSVRAKLRFPGSWRVRAAESPSWSEGQLRALGWGLVECAFCSNPLTPWASRGGLRPGRPRPLTALVLPSGRLDMLAEAMSCSTPSASSASSVEGIQSALQARRARVLVSPDQCVLHPLDLRPCSLRLDLRPPALSAPTSSAPTSFSEVPGADDRGSLHTVRGRLQCARCAAPAGWLDLPVHAALPSSRTILVDAPLLQLLASSREGGAVALFHHRLALRRPPSLHFASLPADFQPDPSLHPADRVVPLSLANAVAHLLLRLAREHSRFAWLLVDERAPDQRAPAPKDKDKDPPTHTPSALALRILGWGSEYFVPPLSTTTPALSVTFFRPPSTADLAPLLAPSAAPVYSVLRLPADALHATAAALDLAARLCNPPNVPWRRAFLFTAPPDAFPRRHRIQ